MCVIFQNGQVISEFDEMSNSSGDDGDSSGSEGRDDEGEHFLISCIKLICMCAYECLPVCFIGIIISHRMTKTMLGFRLRDHIKKLLTSLLRVVHL